MKKLLLAIALAGICHAAGAAPFLQSDPSPTAVGVADSCAYQEGTAAIVVQPLAQIAPSTQLSACKFDLAGVSAGNHAYKVWFNSNVWGPVSSKVDFSYTRPGVSITGPANLRIDP